MINPNSKVGESNLLVTIHISFSLFCSNPSSKLQIKYFSHRSYLLAVLNIRPSCNFLNKRAGFLRPFLLSCPLHELFITLSLSGILLFHRVYVFLQVAHNCSRIYLFNTGRVILPLHLSHDHSRKVLAHIVHHLRLHLAKFG